jgi:hypothetical protein
MTRNALPSESFPLSADGDRSAVSVATRAETLEVTVADNSWFKSVEIRLDLDAAEDRTADNSGALSFSCWLA